MPVLPAQTLIVRALAVTAISLLLSAFSVTVSTILQVQQAVQPAKLELLTASNAPMMV